MSFIEFILIEDSSRKTKQWYIRNKSNITMILGYISFYPQWRKYVYHNDPQNRVILDSGCLIEIANFCKEQTELWKKGLEDAKI